MTNAFAQFNQQLSQYYTLGQSRLPPPQLNLASIFPTHASSGVEQDGTKNSTNGEMQGQGENNSGYTPQYDPTSSQHMNNTNRRSFDAQTELETWFGPTIGRMPEE